MELFDSHAHYNDERFKEDKKEILEEIYASGVTRLVNAGYSLNSSEIALETAKQYDWIYTISGISPNDIPENDAELDDMINKLERFLNKEFNSNKIVGIRRNWIGLLLGKKFRKKGIAKKGFYKANRVGK